MKDKSAKRKILKDRYYPGTDQINKHQDFEGLMKDYSMIKNLMLKKIGLWSAIIVVTASVATFAILNRSTVASQQNVTEATPEVKNEIFIQPPIPGKEIPFATYIISSKNAATITYPTGSSLQIPAGAFLNPNGKTVSDSIEIRYREFHDPLEIFLSGIPMTYDSAGTKYTLESAGMLEIRAVDKGEELRLKENTPIHVNIASRTNDTRFNLYELDTINRNWVCRGKDKVEEPLARQTVTSDTKQVANAKSEIIPPMPANPEKYSFNIDADGREFPELSVYDSVLFEVTDDNFNDLYYNVEWDNVTFFNSDVRGVYILKLKKGDTTITVKAKPVFDKDDYPRALEKFEKAHQASSRTRDEEAFKKQQKISEVNKSLATYNTDQMVRLANRMVTQTFRSFDVFNTGVHNCDYPIPPIVAYAYSFKAIKPYNKTVNNVNGSEFSYSTIFMIEKGKNTVFRFSKGEPVRCNPKVQNLIWTLTDKNEIAFFRISDYSKLVNGGSNDIVPDVVTNQDMAFAEIKKFGDQMIH